MNRLRNRLILVFVLATLPPLGLTLWTGLSLLGYKLTPLLQQLSELSSALVKTGRELSQQSREAMKRDVAEGRLAPLHLSPQQAAMFWETGQPSEFDFSGEAPASSAPDGTAARALSRHPAGATAALSPSTVTQRWLENQHPDL